MEYQPKRIIAEPIEFEPEISKPREQMPEVPGKPGVSLEMSLEEKPLALFKEPYLIQHLNLDKKIITPDFEKKINIIDLWLKNEIGARDYKPNVKSYIDILEEVKGKLGIANNVMPFSQVMRLFDIIEKSWEDKKLEKKLGFKIIPTFSGI